MKKVIAIIPAYNEEKNIAEVIDKTKKYVDEVVVVDDGSADNTSNASKKADFILRHVINMGKGVALKTGFEFALKRDPYLIVTIDADGQHDPKEIPGLISKLNETGADIAIGTRAQPQNMPFIYRYGNFFIRLVFRALFNDIIDTQSGFRIFKPAIYDKIKWDSSHYEVETEVLANAIMNKVKCVEAPISTIYQDHYKGTTIVDGIKIVLMMLKEIFKMVN